MNRFILIILLMLLMIGCQLDPNYTRPESPVNYERLENNFSSIKSEFKGQPLIEWKEFFESASLQEVIQQALDNNRDLRIATLNIEAARAVYRIQRSELVPNINLQPSVERQKISASTSQNGQSRTSTQYNANLGTSYMIDLFGMARSLNKSALEQFLASEEARKMVQISLIAETVNSYLEWLSDCKILGLVNETLTTQEKIYDIAKISYEKGIGSKLDLDQAEAMLETAKISKANNVQRIEQDKNALELLIGQTDFNKLLAEASFDQIKLKEDFPINLSSETLLLRPDIQQAEHLLKAENANIGAARSAFFPIFSLTGMIGFASNSLNNLFNGGATSGAWNFIPQMTLPIFDGGKNRANLDSAKVKQKIAVANYEKTIQNAFKEVADELIAHEQLAYQLQFQSKILKTAENSYDLVDKTYQIGSKNIVNMFSSRQAYLAAQQNYTSTKKDQLINLVNLYRALGGGE